MCPRLPKLKEAIQLIAKQNFSETRSEMIKRTWIIPFSIQTTMKKNRQVGEIQEKS